MISEARLLIRTRKAGLSVPSVWDLDYEGGQLIIEHLGGRPLIEVLNDSATTEKQAKSTLYRVGGAVRRLHRVATTHGDLSSNNVLIEGEDVHLIDFGLASIEYDVEHPPWKTYQAADPVVNVDAEGLYGEDLAKYLSGPPSSVIIVDGSKTAVHSPKPTA